MTVNLPRPELTALLAETRWVRRLAGSLVADPDDADDLAQDACLVALLRPPARNQNLRAWVRTVMRNLLVQQGRSTFRRKRRETEVEAERRRSDVAAADLVERATAHRAVVDAVLALAPPFRDTVLLRFFEGLPPRAIAQRLQVPVATVHSRLQRAYAQLRPALDRAHGPRQRWQRAVLPVLPASFSLPSLASSAAVLAMKTKILAIATAVIASAAALWIGLRSTEPGAVREEPRAANEDSGGGEAPAVASGTERVALPAAAPSVAATESVTRQCSGRVVDVEGRGVPELRLLAGASIAVSDATGGFAIAAGDGGSLAVRADDARWRTILEGIVRDGAAPPPVLVVVAPTVRLAGHVRSSSGEALATATLRVVWPRDLRSRLSHINDTASESTIATRSRADGAFELDAAAVRGAELLVVAEGHLPQRRQVPAAAEVAMVIVLERLDSMPGTVRGQVLDPSGRVVAGARIGLGSALTRSDADGSFALPDDGKAAALSASAVGQRRAVLERGEHGFPAFAVLTLGGTPLVIRGRVVDEHGNGLPDIAVWPSDPTVLCESDTPLAVEGIARGLSTMAELRERFERGEFAGQAPRQVMRANATSAWPWVRTDADGSFALDGLEDRSYRLRALDNDTLLMVEMEEVAAGSAGVRLVLDQSALFTEIAGQVVTRTGSPVAGARISVQIDAQRLRGNTMHAQAVASAVSDAQGRFALSRVPKASAYFRVEGDDILPSEPGRDLAGGILELCGGRAQDIRLEVRQRMHVQIELTDATRADAIAVLDGSGERVTLNVFRGRSRSESDELALAEGRSPVFVAPDTAHTLVLLKQGKEVARETLLLRSGDVNTVRL